MVTLASERAGRSRSTSATSDTQLDLVRNGDRTACEAFIIEHAPQMLAVARRYLRCEHDSADAVQDAFVSAFRGLSTFEGAASVSTWLHRIVVNVCLMKLRSKARRRVVAIEDLPQTFDAEGRHTRPVLAWNAGFDAAPDRSEVRAAVRECVEALPDVYREVLILRDIEEMDTDTTAQMLDISPANVKVRLHRARQVLRTLLQPVLSESFVEAVA